MRDQTGCTLIEVLIATTILAVGLASLSQLFTLAAGSNLASTHRTHAALLAAQKLEELRSMAWGLELAEGTSDTVAEYTRQWSTRPLPTAPDTASVVDVVVAWNRTPVARLTTIKARRSE